MPEFEPLIDLKQQGVVGQTLPAVSDQSMVCELFFKDKDKEAEAINLRVSPRLRAEVQQ